MSASAPNFKASSKRSPPAIALVVALLAAVLSAPAASGRNDYGPRAPSAATPTQQVLGFTGTGRDVVLTRLDARTLAPVRGAPRLRLGIRPEVYAFTRDRSRLAVAGSLTGVLIVDPVRLRFARRLTGSEYRFGPDYELWDMAWAGSLSLVFVGGCQCGALAYLWTDLPGRFGERGGRSGETSIWAGPDLLTWERTRGGLAVLMRGPSFHLDLLDAFGHTEVTLEGRQPNREPALAADAAHDRLFVITPAGRVGEVQRIASRNPTVSYHDVQVAPPNGDWSVRRAAWLGANTLAVWGVDGTYDSPRPPPPPAGLTFVDTLSWTARRVDPAITDAVAASGSVIGWTAGAPTGVTVYGADGVKRLRALTGSLVRSVEASGNYAYVSACAERSRPDSCSRFSVQLHTGRVTGPLRSRARLILR